MKLWLIIQMGAVLHLIWGVCLIVSPSVASITGIAITSKALGTWQLGILLIAVAALAQSKILIKKRHWTFMLMIPQQFMLFLSAEGAIRAIWMGQYPDETVRTRLFIACDQAPAILMAGAHLVAVLITSGEELWNTSPGSDH